MEQYPNISHIYVQKTRSSRVTNMYSFSSAKVLSYNLTFVSNIFNEYRTD